MNVGHARDAANPLLRASLLAALVTAGEMTNVPATPAWLVAQRHHLL
jgi:hypothetical protein